MSNLTRPDSQLGFLRSLDVTVDFHLSGPLRCSTECKPASTTVLPVCSWHSKLTRCICLHVFGRLSRSALFFSSYCTGVSLAFTPAPSHPTPPQHCLTQSSSQISPRPPPLIVRHNAHMCPSVNYYWAPPVPQIVPTTPTTISLRLLRPPQPSPHRLHPEVTLALQVPQYDTCPSHAPLTGIRVGTCRSGVVRRGFRTLSKVNS